MEHAERDILIPDAILEADAPRRPQAAVQPLGTAVDRKTRWAAALVVAVVGGLVLASAVVVAALAVVVAVIALIGRAAGSLASAGRR